MEFNQLHEYREYVWNYFNAYAKARLSTFRFYLIFCTILFAGLATIIDSTEKWFAIILALLLSFLSFIYWKVDVRHKELIDHAIEALEYIEGKFPLVEDDENSKVIRLFCSESERAKSYKKFPKYLTKDSYFTYSACVNMVFGVFGVGGLIIAIILVIK